jgi:hypothetical protein
MCSCRSNGPNRKMQHRSCSRTDRPTWVRAEIAYCLVKAGSPAAVVHDIRCHLHSWWRIPITSVYIHTFSHPHHISQTTRWERTVPIPLHTEMTLKTTLAAVARPLSLMLEDKALLPEPLLAVALYDFEGENEMAELTFAKGQMLVSWQPVIHKPCLM